MLLGPEPPTSTSAQPTTHVCEDGEIQCEVKFKNSQQRRFKNKFSFEVFALLGICPSPELVRNFGPDSIELQFVIDDLQRT